MLPVERAREATALSDNRYPEEQGARLLSQRARAVASQAGSEGTVGL